MVAGVAGSPARMNGKTMQDRPGKDGEYRRRHQYSRNRESCRRQWRRVGITAASEQDDEDDQHGDRAYVDQQLRQAQELGAKIKVKRSDVRQTQPPAPTRNAPGREASSPRTRQPRSLSQE